MTSNQGYPKSYRLNHLVDLFVALSCPFSTASLIYIVFKTSLSSSPSSLATLDPVKTAFGCFWLIFLIEIDLPSQLDISKIALSLLNSGISIQQPCIWISFKKIHVDFTPIPSVLTTLPGLSRQDVLQTS